MAARIGGVMAPFVTLVVYRPNNFYKCQSLSHLQGDFYPTMELVIFGLVAITAGLLNLLLPETKDKPLPESIDDMWRLRESVLK